MQITMTADRRKVSPPVIDEMIRETVAENASRIAIVFGSETITYGDLDAQIKGFRKGLSGLGARAGDCVLIALPNCPEFVITYFATAGLGATAQAVDPQLTQDELAERVRDCRPAVIVTLADHVPVFGRVAKIVGTTMHVIVARGGGGPVEPGSVEPGPAEAGPRCRAFADLIVPGGPDAAGPGRADDDSWVYAYSSGSTGEPRRVCRSQANQVAEADHIAASAKISNEDVILCPVPLFHALGQFCCMIVAVRAGATLVLFESGDGQRGPGDYPWYVGRLVEVVRDRAVTIFPAVPYIFAALADLPASVPADFSSVRLCLSGSNFLDPAVQGRFEARFGVPIRQTYGSSEAGSVSWDCDPGAATPGSVGRPLRGVTVQIVGDDGRLVPPGAVGEIAVRSAAVMCGYADRGQFAVFRSGDRYLTGDLGRLDEQGRLYLTGRKRILIDIGGHKVNPVEVEDVLAAHAAVREAAVVAVPLPGGGSLLVAAVRADPVPDAARLREHCQARLADYKVPGRFAFVPDIPRSALGKVRRELLVRQLEAAGVIGDAYGLPGGWRQRDLPARTSLIRDYLVRELSAVLAVPAVAVKLEATLRSQGLDSLGALQLKMAVQGSLSQPVGLPDLLGPATVGALADRLARDGADPSMALLASGGRQTGEYPLSYNQRSIWHADHLDPVSAIYNKSFAARVSSGCDTEALRRAFQSLADRHAILRTTYGIGDGVPLQRVAGHADVDFEVVDVPRGWYGRGDELSEEAYRPFDLAAAPPLRVRLYLVPGSDPVLLVTVHHIATDFWSLITMMREVGAAYDAERAGQDIYRPPPAHTYPDYAAWLAAHVSGPAGERDWAYWQDQLRDLPPAVSLPADRPRPAVQAHRGDTYFHALRPDSVARLRAFAQATDTTVFTVLLTLFYALLHAYTGQCDLAAAVMTTSRQRTEFRDVLGYFSNPVVCRSALDAEGSFTALLQAVQQRLLSALEHQLLPFEVVIERLGLSRDRSRVPLADVAFGQSKAHDAGLLAVARFLAGGSGHRLELGSLVLESLPLQQRGAGFDFSGAVYEDADDISIAWEYNSELFTDRTVRVMAGQFEGLLRGALARPGQPVGRLGVLSDADRRRVLAASRGAPPPAGHAGLLGRLAAQARAAPDRIVVSADGGSLSRRELQLRSRRLAGRLSQAGVSAGAHVAIWLPASADLAVAGLAALMPGAVAEPLPDESTPDRVLGRLASGGVTALVTTAARATLVAGTIVPVLAVEDGSGAPPGRWRPARDLPAGRPAVVLRTSGVTGEPRALLADYRMLTRYATHLEQAYGPLGDVLMPGSLAPDLALVRMLSVAASGGTAVLAPGARSAAGLAAILGSGRSLSLVMLTPTELALVLAELTGGAGGPSTLPRVACLAVSGEALPWHLVRQWRALAGDGARLMHEYGSAETGLLVSAAEVPPGPADEDPIPADMDLVPAGRPAPGVERYVLDRSGRLCPAGVTGEICVGEQTVARALSGAPLAAERFIAHPFARVAGARLLRTGDLGYYRDDGAVVVLGREAELVSVRGYRVDLSVVEAALSALRPGSRAVVLPDERGSLRAQVTPGRGDGGVPSGGVLRQQLRRLVPDYMVPAEITVAGRLLAAANGKVRRHARPAAGMPAAGTPSAAYEPQPELTPAEAILATIWQKVLGVRKVGPDDDYFDLDGDSLASPRIVAMAADAGLLITSRQVFTCPTLRDLAAAAVPVTGEAGTQPAGPAARHNRRGQANGPVPLAPMQQWFFDRGLADAQRWNQTILLSVGPGLDDAVLPRALQAVAAHHRAFRLRFTRTPEGQWAQREDPAAQAIRVTPYLPPAGPPARRDLPAQLAAQVQDGMDLAAGPLLAAAITGRDRSGRRLLCLSAHHLVIDFASWQIFLDDLARACRQVHAGEEVRLPDVATSFPDWARRLPELAASADIVAELDQWAGPQAGVPSGRPRTGAPGGPGAGRAGIERAGLERDAGMVTAVLPAASTARLLAVGAGRGGGPRTHEIVLAATAHAFAVRSGDGRVCVDVETHGRQPLPGGADAGTDLTRTIGWLTAVYPLRYRSERVGRPAEALGAVLLASRGSRSHGLACGLLRYASADPGVRARMAALPAASVGFNYLGGAGHLLGDAGSAPDGREMFAAVPAPDRGDRGPDNTRPYPWEVSARVSSGRLVLAVSYNQQDQQRGEVADLAAGILRNVRAIVAERALS